ncbi:MAG: hypothetical protein ACP5OP_01775 [Leptospirillia bacterium]
MSIVPKTHSRQMPLQMAGGLIDRTFRRTYPFMLIAAVGALGACAQTNALIGNHQNAAYNYRTSSQSLEKAAKKESDLQNHILAAKKFIDAAGTRLSSAQEYQKIGNPVWAKNMFDRATADLNTAANEIKSAQSPISGN